MDSTDKSIAMASEPGLAPIDRAARPDPLMLPGIDFLRTSRAAACCADADGRITFYNAAAAELWGTEPVLGSTMFCGSWRLYWPDGRLMPHDESPMAIALRERRPLRGVETVAERPDGTRVAFLAYPTPLIDDRGELIGAVNMMVETGERELRVLESQYLAAIVESSDDAILAKNLDGTLTSWNRGAEWLFGYTAEEAVGQPVTLIIPPDRLDEEPRILARLRKGERIDHFETVRRHKDGSLVDVSLTVSPIKAADGSVVGASKVARDITERRRASERQSLLLGEMNHRVKNLLVLAGSLIALSARSATTVKQLESDVRERLGALARAHELTLPTSPERAVETATATTLHAVIDTVVAPFDDRAEVGDRRIRVVGPDVPIAAGGPLTSMALLLHEFATNAAKYGALSTAEGTVSVECAVDGDRLIVTWAEHGGPAMHLDAEPPSAEGFGSVLARATVEGQLGGEIVREWRPDGLTIRLSVVRARLEP